jgi:hypothetical protein
LAARDDSSSMTCFYPEGKPTEWCERHARDHAMIVAMRAARMDAAQRASA